MSVGSMKVGGRRAGRIVIVKLVPMDIFLNEVVVAVAVAVAVVVVVIDIL